MHSQASTVGVFFSPLDASGDTDKLQTFLLTPLRRKHGNCYRYLLQTKLDISQFERCISSFFLWERVCLVLSYSQRVYSLIQWLDPIAKVTTLLAALHHSITHSHTEPNVIFPNRINTGAQSQWASCADVSTHNKPLHSRELLNVDLRVSMFARACTSVANRIVTHLNVARSKQERFQILGTNPA